MFDQDPNEQANISGADLAIMVDELKAAKELIEQLVDACHYYCNPDDAWSPRIEQDKIVKALAAAKDFRERNV